MRLTPRNIRAFRSLIKRWGADNLRDYPWRHSRDPYEVAVAELMLRRTQADQVVPVYREFLATFPAPDVLVAADSTEVRGILRPLGLAWRAQNIIDFSRAVVDRFGGEVPLEDHKLRELPGVGVYVSASIRCFALGQAVPIVDTNTVRVVGRVFGLSTAGEARRRKEMVEAIARCVDREEPRLYNLSLLDFASSICTARNPRHAQCEFSKWRRCVYYAQQARQDGTG